QIAAEEEDLADMLKINRLWFLILFQLNIPLKEKSKILYERLKIKEELIKKQATEEYRHLQFLESSIEKLNRSIGETYTEKPLEKEKTIIFEESDTALSSYFRSEEHTSELQSRENLVCRLLLEKKKLLRSK